MANLSFVNLRSATGLSQPDFANLLGVSVETVRQIEQERGSVSERVARKAFIATGALPASLLNEEAAEVQAWDREPYRPEHFEAWKRISAGDVLAGIDGGIPGLDRFLGVVKSILCAAGAENRLGRVQAALSLAIFDAIFAEGLSAGAQHRAHSDGRGEDFDRLATFAGRMESTK